MTFDTTIYKQAAIDILTNIDCSDGVGISSLKCDVINEAITAIKALPPAQTERKKGKWIITSVFEDCRYAKCNQCKVTQVFYYNKPLTNFCPNCGADMRNKQDR